jgi:hypothetical protein
MSTPLVTRTVTITSQGANGQTLTTSYVVTGNEEINISETMAIGTNVLIALNFPHANLQCVDITASSATTFKFNSSGSPVPSLSVTPTSFVHWDVNQYSVNATAWPNPFTADVTALYVTNAAASTINLSFLLLN